MTYYFSIFLPVREGGYAIFFPDFPEIASEGETVDECMVMAQDALSITVEEYAKARRELPAPSTLERVQAVAQKELEDETVDASRPPLFQLFGAPDMDMTPVRINISLPKCVLEGLDRKACARGMTRSALIAKAAQAYM